ncbi:hypothetical protein LVD13_02490 [Flavobacteriaceae bacterium D16]|nr:hypothetical protein [Flavobacteriaceae bacterium D16]
MDKKYKKEGFKVPDGYFEGLNKRLMDRLDQENLDLPGDDGFAVPEGYFDSLQDKLSSRIGASQENKVIRLNPWKKYYLVAASIAALVVIVIGFRLGQTEEFTFSDLASAELETYLEENDLGLTSYEIAEVLPIEEIEVNDILDNELNEENIIDYLDENVEDLYELNIEYNE